MHDQEQLTLPAPLPFDLLDALAPEQDNEDDVDFDVDFYIGTEVL